MYLEQFKRDAQAILKYLPFVVGFIGFMALNIMSAYLFQSDTSALIQDSIERLGKNVTFITMVVPFVFLLGLLFLCWIFIHKSTLTKLTTARKKVDWKRIFFSFFVWTAVNVLVLGISILLQPNDYQFQFRASAFVPLLLISLVFIPIQTSFEEYFFRGYFMQFVALLSKNKGVALFLSSVVFGLMHASNPEVAEMGPVVMIFYIGSGFLLGIMTLMDDGLELALGFHAANNLFGALVITSNSAVFQTDALFVFSGSSSINELLIQVFIIFPTLLYFFSKKYRWKNWQQKLFNRLNYETKY